MSTWPLKAGALRFGRTFLLEKDKKPIARAFTEWCLLNADTNEVLRSSVLTMPIDEYLTDKGIEGKFSGAKADAPALVYSHTVRASDLDINRHVNNITYIKFALDCFDTKELESIDIKSFEMYYVSQCFEGQTLELYRQDNLIEAVCDGRTVFRCTINL